MSNQHDVRVALHLMMIDARNRLNQCENDPQRAIKSLLDQLKKERKETTNAPIDRAEIFIITSSVYAAHSERLEREDGMSLQSEYFNDELIPKIHSVVEELSSSELS